MKISKQVNKDKNKSKYELGIFCEQDGLPQQHHQGEIKRLKNISHTKHISIINFNLIIMTIQNRNLLKSQSILAIKNLVIIKMIKLVINVIRKIITKVNVGQKSKLINYKYLNKIRIKSLKYSN